MPENATWNDATKDLPPVGESVLVVNGGFICEAMWDGFAFCETRSWEVNRKFFMSRLGAVSHWKRIIDRPVAEVSGTPTREEIEASTK